MPQAKPQGEPVLLASHTGAARLPCAGGSGYTGRMTIVELHRDEALRNYEFPVTRDRVFLAHAGVAPLPRRVQAALAAYAEACTRGDQEEMLPPAFFGTTRDLLARLLQAAPEEIAFIGPTSNALGTVAAGLEFSAGDNVVLYFEDYPSNVYPWTGLAARGVEPRFVQPRQFGVIEVEDVLAKVDRRTKLVALASAHFIAGCRLPWQELGQALRERGVLFSLDAIQTLGALPMEKAAVDFLAADAHKWLLGPCAAGVLYVRREQQEKLAPSMLGWHNVLCPGFVAQPVLELRRGARRYEPGTANLIGLIGFKAALELLFEVGIDAIATELLRKRAWLIPALQAQGWTVLGADLRPHRATGLITFHRAGTDMSAAHRKLIEAGIVTSLRTDRTGQAYLRLSPHFYNTDAELQQMLDTLPPG